MADTDIQVAVVTTSNIHDLDVTTLLRMEPGQSVPSELALEQRKDPAFAQIIAFMENVELPAGNRLYNVLVRHWWWQGMYTDTLQYCKNCPQCAVVNGCGRRTKPPLQPILVE